MTKLDGTQKHILRLIAHDLDAEGWTPVSERVWPLVAAMPDRLVEKRRSDVGGQARLTSAGKEVEHYL